MAIDQKDWKNDPVHETPLSAEAIEDIEGRMGAYTDSQVTAEAAARDAAIADAIALIPPGYTDADVKRVIAALASGEKVAWETAGGDFVELYGVLTPAGSWGLSFSDPATQNLLATNFDTDNGGLGWGAFVAPPVANAQYGYHATNEQYNGATLKTSMLAAQSGPIRVVVRVGPLNAPGDPYNGGAALMSVPNAGPPFRTLVAGYNGFNGRLELHDHQRGAGDTLLAQADLPAGENTALRSDRFLAIQRNSDGTITAEYWRGDPDAGGVKIASIDNFGLTGSQVARYGSGVNVRAAFTNGTGTPFFNEFRAYLQVAEQRDLFLAVTAAGGTRTVKRILGTVGTAVPRSDFAMLTDLATKLDATGVKALLAALVSGDKFKWTYGGNNVVEVWGEATPAGYGVSNSSDFTATQGWTNQYGSGGSISSNQLNFSGDTSWVNTGWGTIDDTRRFAADVTMLTSSGGGGPTQGVTVGFQKTQGTFPWDNLLGLKLVHDGRIQLTYGQTTNNVVDVAPAGTVAMNVGYRCEITRAGNNCHLKVTRIIDSVIIYEGDVAIPASGQATFGVGKTLDTVNIAGFAGTATIDNATLYQTVPEAHDLWCAITPAGGVRTVYRIIGSSGPATFRSDFRLKSEQLATGDIADDAITAAKIAAGAVGASEIADGSVGLNELSATGTKDATTFLRGDNTFAVPPGTGGGGGSGVPTGTAFPAITGEGQEFIRIDQPGNPTYKVVNGVWEQQPRMGAQNVPMVRALKAGSQSIPTAVDTVISFPDADDFDTDGVHDPATNNSRLIIKTPGRYLVSSSFGVPPSAAGNWREATLWKNGVGTTSIARNDLGLFGSGTHYVNVSGVITLAAGDYVEVSIYQDSGGNLSISDAKLSAIWVGGAGQTIDERGVPSFSAYLSANQSIPGGAVATKLGFNGKSYDTDGCFDTTLNRFTCKTPGLYDLKILLPFEDNGALWLARLYKNGARYRDILSIGDQSGTSNPYLETSQDVLCAAGDYFEVFVFNTAAATAFNVWGGATEYGRAIFSGSLVGSGKTVTPYARATKAASQSIPHNTSTSISFEGEEADNDNIHDTITNTTRLTCKTAGTYMISAALTFAANNDFGRGVSIIKNGVSTVAANRQRAITQALNVMQVNAAGIIELAVGDYIEATAYQDTGAALDVTSGSLTMVKVGSPSSGFAAEPIPGVTPLTLKNGWVAIAGRTQPGYYVDRGRLYLVGHIDGTAATGNNAFDLPAGARPSATIDPAMTQSFNAAGNASTRVEVQIQAAGAVSFFSEVGGGMAGNANSKFMCLEGINFRI